MTKHHILIAGFLLSAFAATGTGLVALTNQITATRIQENENQSLLQQLLQLVPASSYDNDLVQDKILLNRDANLGNSETVTAYRARKLQQPVAVIFPITAPDGYSGEIHLLVGIFADGTIAGTRVISHKETPGLGDKIEVARHPWILGFNQKSLTHPDAAQWLVKKDGGYFDQLTGATITPRAIVKAVKKSLLYFQQHREALFEERPPHE